MKKTCHQNPARPATRKPRCSSALSTAIFLIVSFSGCEQVLAKTYTVTAYCACKVCCGPNAKGITASGHHIRLKDRFVAADRSIPFGTKIIVPGYNHGRPVPVLDRGTKIKGDRLDVFFDSHSEAKKWGVRTVRVRVLSYKF